MKKEINGIILSSKREVDLTSKDYSILRLMEAGKAKGINMKVLKPEQFEMIVTQPDQTSILVNDEPMPLPDFVLPRMGASTTFYALSVIRQLENLGVYVCNSAKSIAAVKDKLYMHQCLAHSKLVTPKTMLAKYPVNLDVVKREIGFPLVIKNVSGSHGTGIYLSESEEKFSDIMELVFTNNSRANLILQEFIHNSRGQDLRVFIIGGKVIGCMKRTSQKSFKANFSRGGSVSSFSLTPEIEWLATETAKLFNLDIAGVDLLFDKHEFKICEANSSPQFCGLEQVVGKNVAENIIDYILVKIGSNVEVS